MTERVEVLIEEPSLKGMSDGELQTLVRIEELRLAQTKHRWSAIAFVGLSLSVSIMCHAVCGS